MLVIDPTSDPSQEYNPYNESEGMFGQNIEAPYHAHNDANLIPRDVIQEDENERTQDSALIKITEEREETKQSHKGITSQSNLDAKSQITPPKIEENILENDGYEDDYEEDEPVPTKPFQNKTADEGPINQEEYLQMLSNPVNRPSTRNPRMQRDKSENKNKENRANEESLGDIGQKEENANLNKINEEIKGGFTLSNDSED